MKTRALIVIVVLLAAVSHAGWRASTVSGLPVDVHLMPDAGDFIVTTGTLAQVMSCPEDGGACTSGASQSGTGLVAAAPGPGACIIGLQTSGNVTGCGSSGQAAGPGTTGLRIRCSPSGFCTALAGTISQQRWAFATPPAVAPWALQLVNFTTANDSPLTILSKGGVEYSVAPALSVAQSPWITVDGGVPLTIPGALGAQVRDVVLFSSAAGGIGLMLTQSGGSNLLYGSDLTVGAGVDAGWLPTFLDPTVAPFGRVGYTELSGSPRGVGFGVATQLDGGVELAGPIPDPSAPGRQWERRTQTPGVKLAHVQCFDPTFCVGFVADAGSPNVFYYWNNVPPGGSLGSVGVLIGPGSTARVTAAVSDGDGDPLFITWENDGGAVTVAPDPDGGPRDAIVTARLIAGTSCIVQVPVTAIVSDGYGPHDRQVSLIAPLNYDRGAPDQPSISPNPPPPVFAGLDAGVVLTATTDGGCVGTYTWSSDAGALIGGGTSVELIPPPTFCQASGGAGVEVTSTRTGGSLSDQVTVPIIPWGVPETPAFGSASPVWQDAGSSVTYPLTGPTHACQMTPGFPDVATIWTWQIDGGAVTVTGLDGSVVVNSMDSCVRADVDITAQYVVNGEDAGRLSPVTALNVDVEPTVTPLTGFGIGAHADAGGAEGDIAVQGSCLAQRNVTATVSIPGATPVTGLAPGQHWFLPIPGSCAGGMYTVTGTLFEGMTQVSTVMQTVNLLPTDAEIGVLRQSQLPVSCNGLAADVAFTVPSGKCPVLSTDVTWTQDAGPPVTGTWNGQTLHVTSGDSLDTLVGQTLGWVITMDAGVGNGDQQLRSLVLTHSFVRLEHGLAPSAPGSDDVTTVEVTVTNADPCGVSELVLREQPNGMRFIPGTAFADREPLLATLNGSTLELGPFPLAAKQTRIVRYAVRVPMLGAPMPTGEAWVRGARVTIDATTVPPPPGCGCGFADGGGLVVALFWLLRRRRAPLTPTLSPLRGEGG